VPKNERKGERKSSRLIKRHKGSRVSVEGIAHAEGRRKNLLHGGKGGVQDPRGGGFKPQRKGVHVERRLETGEEGTQEAGDTGEQRKMITQRA